MKQPIRIRGWISTANLINPRKLFTDEVPKYYLAFQPENPIDINELQEQVNQKNMKLRLRIHQQRALKMRSLKGAKSSSKQSLNLG